MLIDESFDSASVRPRFSQYFSGRLCSHVVNQLKNLRTVQRSETFREGGLATFVIFDFRMGASHGLFACTRARVAF